MLIAHFNFEFAFCHHFLHITFYTLNLANSILRIIFGFFVCIEFADSILQMAFNKQTAFCILQNSRKGQLFVFFSSVQFQMTPLNIIATELLLDQLLKRFVLRNTAFLQKLEQ